MLFNHSCIYATFIMLFDTDSFIINTLLMRRINNYTLFLFIIFSQMSYGQKNFVAGTLGLTNGEVLECEFVLQIKNSKEGLINQDHKRLKYRLSAKDDVNTIGYSELDYILVNNDKNKMLLRRLYSYRLRVADKPHKKSKYKSWFQFRAGCEDIASYLAIQEFSIDKNGQAWETYLDGMGALFLMRDGEDAPTNIGFVFLRKVITQRGFDKQMKKMLDKYFDGESDGMDFLKNKTHMTANELKDYILDRCGYEK